MNSILHQMEQKSAWIVGLNFLIKATFYRDVFGRAVMPNKYVNIG